MKNLMKKGVFCLVVNILNHPKDLEVPLRYLGDILIIAVKKKSKGGDTNFTWSVF